MDELAPKFSIMPKNPYNCIVGLVEPELLDVVADSWKNSFRSVYGHDI